MELLNVEDVVKQACERAARLCKKYCGVAPEVQITATASAAAPFMYVESHLHHVVSFMCRVCTEMCARAREREMTLSDVLGVTGV